MNFKPVLALLGTLSLGAVAQAQTAIILDGTVTGGAASLEANACIANGVNVNVVSDAVWATTTTAQFASYRAIILGDPTCFGPGLSPSAATATATTNVWGPAADGNTIIIGTDEVFHQSQGGLQFNNDAVGFVLADATKTGALISLSCYYDSTASGTPVPMLDGLPNVTPGAFTVTGVNCYNNAHIVASHPALAGSTDATLSNWSCSVHEAFVTWQGTGINPFLVLAIARDFGSVYTAPDGSVGTPYILARGAGLVVDSNITLSPALTLCKPINSNMSLVATVTENGVPVVGVTVTFSVIAGPNNGLTGNDVTNGAGQAKFNFTSAVPGVDTVIAQYVDSTGATQTSNTAAVEWCEAECYLVVGRGGGTTPWTIGTTTFNTQLGSVRQYWVVTMADNPALNVPNVPVGSTLSFSAQVLMRNPVQFPGNPDQWSQRLRVVIHPGYYVSGELFGSSNGINLSLATFTDPAGSHFMRFPFVVQGM